MTLHSDRNFQVWEYQVSHGQLLIRSPKAPATKIAPERLTNIDIVCVGVEYMALPRALARLRIAEASLDEVQQLEDLLGKTIKPETIRIFESDGRRFPVIAVAVSVSENDWDIFESPFKFRSQFHGE
jgi:hypothetical protein